ncbi:TetR/AcrR family transcriptional regulator [Corynebacterium epidermidicanis]|uniref:Transcriptional regulator, TetR family n=1 Tax=Corynebacterium epidermidicanis TaxID=1050174 RepID=A0A0G3GRX2_9CORY|nr:TetR family transcriptional regulator [Corynebacterium epidermidicanis]AKK03941.1 transcriptional regulator, TetR family [Corynebacterium epidermidicanis]
MRTSKRTEILQAAIELIEVGGVESVTYEALATHSGLSKSGLVYHFPSRHDILLGVHQFLAQRWAEELVAAGGAPAHELDQVDRLRAYILTLSRKATRADLLVAIDAHSHPDYLAQWQQVTSLWSPGPDDPDYALRLQADGLWLHDQVSEVPLTPEQRELLTQQLLSQLDRRN